MSTETNRPYAVLILRAALGVVFLAHAWLKIGVFGLPGTVAYFESVGLPGVTAYPVFLLEVVGGVLLLAGLYTRWAALSLVAVVAGASLVHWPNGWVFSNPGGGWEFPVFVAIACLALFLLGEDGALSVGAPRRRLPHQA